MIKKCFWWTIILLQDIIKWTDVCIEEKFMQKSFCLLFTRKVAFTPKSHMISRKQKIY